MRVQLSEAQVEQLTQVIESSAWNGSPTAEEVLRQLRDAVKAHNDVERQIHIIKAREQFGSEDIQVDDDAEISVVYEDGSDSGSDPLGRDVLGVWVQRLALGIARTEALGGTAIVPGRTLTGAPPMNANVRRTLEQWRAGKMSPVSQRGTAVWTDGDNTIWSYRTALFSARSGVFNGTKYSATTSRIQNQLLPVLPITAVQAGAPIGIGPAALDAMNAERNAGGAK